ncbi:hypothetical protein FOL47_011360 [Perkinsus chesapeaki]|uniref:Uncharacterized protein n=1 Tax=Perkinsus chesapeaki TaxID=330153 RepID=A0A7J6MMH4_PERCH|nr:hypothetical protein FOL47_011360 [Perkinsus chesapeaki]
MPVSEGIQEIVEKHCDDEIILKAVLEVLESGAVSRVALLAGLKDSDIDFLRDAVLEKDDSLKVKKVAIGATFRALVREASFQMDLAETAGRVKHAASRQEQSVIALKSRLKTLKSLFGLDTIDNDVFPTLEVFNKLKSSLGTFVDFKRELHNCKYVPSEKNVLLNLSTGEGQPALAAIPLKESGAGETPDDKLGGSSWLSCFNRYMLGLLLADCDAGDKGVRDNGDGHLPLPNIDPLTLLTYQAKISQIASDSGWSVATLVDDRFRRVVETKFMNGSR